MSAILKRSVKIAGHNTSVSVEEPFWDGLKMLAAQERVSLNALITTIDRDKTTSNLSSAIRVYILEAAKKGLLQNAP